MSKKDYYYINNYVINPFENNGMNWFTSDER